jgi:hypothetical protein
MAKRPSLAESMESVKKSVAQATKPPRDGQSHVGLRPYTAATRQGTKRVTVPLSEEEHKRFKVAAAEKGRSIEDLARELFAPVIGKPSRSKAP